MFLQETPPRQYKMNQDLMLPPLFICLLVCLELLFFSFPLPREPHAHNTVQNNTHVSSQYMNVRQYTTSLSNNTGTKTGVSETKDTFFLLFFPVLSTRPCEEKRKQIEKYQIKREREGEISLTFRKRKRSKQDKTGTPARSHCLCQSFVVAAVVSRRGKKKDGFPASFPLFPGIGQMFNRRWGRGEKGRYSLQSRHQRGKQDVKFEERK